MAHIRLHVQQADGHLPMVCMRCGAPASIVRTKKLSWYPRWILVFLLLQGCGLVLILFLIMALRRRAVLQAPLCEEHQGHWTTRLIINWVSGILAITLSIGGFVAFIALDEMRPRPPVADTFGPLLCLASGFVFVAWLIMVAILNNTSIRPDEITNTHILLNGVSEAFVDAVQDAEIERRVRLRQWQEEDARERPRRVYADDEEIPPRRPASSRDAFEEDGRSRRGPSADAIEE